MSFAIVLFAPITVASRRDKAFPFTRSSILFRPHMTVLVKMVEPLGTAPRSDPLITSAFMSIAQRALRSYKPHEGTATENAKYTDATFINI